MEQQRQSNSIGILSFSGFTDTPNLRYKPRVSRTSVVTNLFFLHMLLHRSLFCLSNIFVLSVVVSTRWTTLFVTEYFGLAMIPNCFWHILNVFCCNVSLLLWFHCCVHQDHQNEIYLPFGILGCCFACCLIILAKRVNNCSFVVVVCFSLSC